MLTTKATRYFQADRLVPKLPRKLSDSDASAVGFKPVGVLFLFLFFCDSVLRSEFRDTQKELRNSRRTRREGRRTRREGRRTRREGRRTSKGRRRTRTRLLRMNCCKLRYTKILDVTNHIAELGHIAESRTSQSYATPRYYVD